MPISVKIPILDQSTVFALPGFSPDGMASAFQRIAAARIARIDEENARAAGVVIPHRLIIDGVAGAPLARVTGSSIIVARWSVGVAAVDYIYELLQNAGPFRSGRYRESMRMYIDGVASTDPRDAAGAREALFLATVPYARKIERGLKGYAPGKVYQAAAEMAAARYGASARIKFTFAEPEGPAPMLERWASTRPRRKGRGANKDLRQPAILVSLG